MRTILLILFSLGTASLFAQSPIVREEYFEEIDNQWKKVSIIERSYNAQGVLTTEQYLYYENALQKWIPQRVYTYDAAGNLTHRFTQYFQGKAFGFFKEDSYRTYNERGQLLVEEIFVQENKNSPQVVSRKTVNDYLDDCSFVSTLYIGQNGGNALIFNSKTLSLYDKNCVLATTISSDKENQTTDKLRSQTRISFITLDNGDEQRVVEQLTCPEIENCEEWEIQDKKTYDKNGRLIYNEIGSTKSSTRQIINIEYKTDRRIITQENLFRTNTQTTQTLLSRDVIAYDLEDQLLFRKRFEPLSFDESHNYYNDHGLLVRNTYFRTTKDSLGLHSFTTETNYDYSYYCDDLPKALITTFENGSKTKTVYSYLYPSDCGGETVLSTLNLYPNPTNSLLQIEDKAFETTILDLEIFDIQGRKIRTFESIRSTSQLIDVSDLPTGVYQISILQSGKRITKPFIKL